MAKIKITTLTDKIKDEEILSRLKGIGVKIKDKEKRTEEQAAEKKTSTASGETVIEKRVASTVIRRRVQAPPAEKKEAVKEPEPEAGKLRRPGRKGRLPLRLRRSKGAEEPVVELVRQEKPKKAAGRPKIEMIERVDEAHKAEGEEENAEAAGEAAGPQAERRRGSRRGGEDRRPTA